MPVHDPDAAPVPSRRRSVILAAVVIVLTFFAGVVVGVIGDRVYLVRHQRVIPTGGIELMGRHLIRRLDRSLDLTAAQEAQVAEIIDRRTERILESSDAVHRIIYDEFAATHAEIEKVLTPEQREKFQRIQKHWHRRKH